MCGQLQPALFSKLQLEVRRMIYSEIIGGMVMYIGSKCGSLFDGHTTEFVKIDTITAIERRN
jgi:hypothetical protein